MFWPVFVVAIMAAIIASQAMLSGAFAILSKALSLGCFPRVEVVHTSSKYEGQVYLPEVNFLIGAASVAVTLGFQTTANIGNAYGICVVTVFSITTHLMAVVMLLVWRTPAALAAAAAASESESDSVVMRESTSIPQQLAASPGHARVRRPRDLGTRRRRRQGPPPYDAAGIAGTLDSPRHPAARFARVPPRPAAPITRSRQARRGASAKAGRLPPPRELRWRRGRGGAPLRRPRAARGGRGSGGIRGIRGGRPANLGGSRGAAGWTGPSRLVWSGDGPRREDEVEEREEWENWGGKEILATSFLVLLGAVLPFRPPRLARFSEMQPGVGVVLPLLSDNAASECQFVVTQAAIAC